MGTVVRSVLAAVGMSAAIAVCATAVGVVVSRVAPPAPPRVQAVDDTIPRDLAYTWAIGCIPPGLPLSSATSFLLSDSGTLTAEVVIVTDQGVTVQPEATATTNACLRGRVLGPDQARRGAKPAERSLIYSWARDWEVPCLAAHGAEVTLPPRSAFFGNATAWNLLDQRPDLGIDTLLAARRACPPLPPFLAAEGVGW